MAGKRRWKDWPKRVANELNGTSGIAGAGGTLLTIGGWALLPSVAAVVTSGVGVLITAGAMGVAAWKAIPPKFRNPIDLVGRRLPLDQLDNVHPPLPKLGIVGPSMVGKSTLLNVILTQPPPDERTQGVHTYVAPLQTNPVQYVAIIDGGGQMLADQFSVAAPADILCIVLDHHRSNSEKNVDKQRLTEHSLFQEQLRGYLATQRNKLAWVHLLLNKQDLWKDAPDQERQSLLEFLLSEVKTWEGGNWARRVTYALHSNRYTDDVGNFLRQIVAFL